MTYTYDRDRREIYAVETNEVVLLVPEQSDADAMHRFGIMVAHILSDAECDNG